MSTLVVGLGNPCLGDDGVGWRIVEKVEKRCRRPAGEVEFRLASLGGISLMEMLIGFEKAIIVDALQQEGGLPGTLHRMTPDDLPSRHANATHDASFKDALSLGKKLGARLPLQIVMVTVDIESQGVLSEKLSPPVEESIPPAVRLVLSEIN